MQNFLEAVSQLLNNAKARTMLVVAGAVLIIGLFVILNSFFGSEEAVQEKPSSVAAVPKNLENIPGGEVTEQYRKLQKTENKTRAQEAKKSGKSSIPTIIGSSVKEKEVDKFLNKKPKTPKLDIAAESAARARARLEEQRNKLAKLQQQKLLKQKQEAAAKAKLAQQQTYSQHVKEVIKNMSETSKSLFTVWNREQKQAFVTGQLADKDSSNFANEENKYQLQAQQKQKITNGESSDLNSSNEKIISAGTVMFGVLKTAINSDEPSPILATVVQGKYKGAQLIGQVSTGNSNAQKVNLTFTKMKLPKHDKSIEVNIIAIDPETARTAIASEVNNHYLLRYGTLFASSFLEGLGEAVGNSNQTTTTTISQGSITTTSTPNSDDIDTKEIIMTSAGKIGQKWGEQLSPIFSTAPTITVDAGVSLGLLFVDDTDVTKKS